jgi:hypothetical protein
LREFGESTSVGEYAQAMSRNSRRGVDALESALTESLDTLNGKLDSLGAPAVTSSPPRSLTCRSGPAGET